MQQTKDVSFDVDVVIVLAVGDVVVDVIVVVDGVVVVDVSFDVDAADNLILLHSK